MGSLQCWFFYGAQFLCISRWQCGNVFLITLIDQNVHATFFILKKPLDKVINFSSNGKFFFFFLYFLIAIDDHDVFIMFCDCFMRIKINKKKITTTSTKSNILNIGKRSVEHWLKYHTHTHMKHPQDSHVIFIRPFRKQCNFPVYLHHAIPTLICCFRFRLVSFLLLLRFKVAITDTPWSTVCVSTTMYHKCSLCVWRYAKKTPGNMF